MKSPALLFAMLAAFTACNDSYEQVMEDNASQEALSSEANSEKLQFGKMYAIDQIPEDIYNHVDKETLDKYIQKYFSDTDSIIFKKNEQVIQNNKTNSNITRSYKTKTLKNIFLDSYDNFDEEVAFSFYADYTCSQDGWGDGCLDDLKIYLKQGRFVKEWIFEFEETGVPFIGRVWYDEHLTVDNHPDVQEGYHVEFSTQGDIIKYNAITGTIVGGRALFDVNISGELPNSVHCVVTPKI